MPVNRHQHARTTLAIRRELRESPLPMAELARRYHLSQATVRQWRRREEGADRSHRPHRLHPTRSPAQEAVVVARRQSWLLPRDDRLAVTRAFLHEGSRAPVWIGAGAARGSRTSAPSCPVMRAVNRPISPSRTMPPAASMLMSSTYRNCPTRTRAATASPPSPAPRAGSSNPFHHYIYILYNTEITLFPAEDDGGGIHFRDAWVDTRVEFCHRSNAEVSQTGPRHFRETLIYYYHIDLA